MDITLKIFHHHFMSSKAHTLNVKINTLQSIMELKQAILDQYPSKIKYFIAPEQFQIIIHHGKIFENSQGVNDLLMESNTSNSGEGQIVLLQFPRTDHHLKQIHDIITDESKVIHPLVLSQKLHISMPRVMKIIHFLEASGFIQIDSSPSTLHNTQNSSYQANLGQIGAIEEEKEEKNNDHNNNGNPPNDFPFIEHDQLIRRHHQSNNNRGGQLRQTMSIPSNISNANVISPSLQLTHAASAQSLPRLNRSRSFSLSEDDRNLLRSSSFLRAVATEIAEQLLFSDQTEDGDDDDAIINEDELEIAFDELHRPEDDDDDNESGNNDEIDMDKPD